MREASSRVAKVLLALAVVATLLAVPLAAADSGEQASSDDTNVTADSVPADYTYKQLNPGGSVPDEQTPASVRLGGPNTEFAVQNLPVGLWVVEGENSPFWQYLTPRTTIERNFIRLLSKRPYTYGGTEVPDQSMVVRIAYWQRGQATVTEDNQTRRVPVAENVTVDVVEVTLSDGRDSERLALDPHYDEYYEVTMCVQAPDEPDCLASPDHRRWRAEHKSSRAAKVVPPSSAGSRLFWGLTIVMVTFGFSVVTLYGSRKAIRHARAGPGISLLSWVIFGIIALVATGIFWDQIVNILVLRPYSIAVPLGILLGVIAAEWYGDETYLSLLLRFRLTDVYDIGAAGRERLERAAKTDGGEDVQEAFESEVEDLLTKGIVAIDAIPVRMARTADGGRIVIQRKLRQFIARMRGAKANVEFEGNPQTMITVEQGPYDEAYLLDPEDDSPYEYRPPDLKPQLPDLYTYEEVETAAGETEVRRTWNLRPYLAGVAALSFSWLVGGLVFASGALGLVCGAVILYIWKVWKPVEGIAHMTLAPMQYNPAIGAMLTHAKGLGNAKTWQDWYHRAVEGEAERNIEQKGLQDDATATQAQKVYESYLGSSESGDLPARRQGRETDREEVPSDDD